MKKTFAILMLMCILTGCSSKDETTAAIEKEVSVEEKITESLPAEVYADDEIINEFITTFKDKSKCDITDISKGSAPTKYHCYINEHWVELLSYAEGLSISINGGQDGTVKQSMFGVLDEILRVSDETLTGDQIEKVIEMLECADYMINDYSVNDNITIETYVPIAEQSNGLTNCRIDLVLHQYK